MPESTSTSRREFVKITGAAAVGASLAPLAVADVGLRAAPAKRRYAIVGTGDRGSGMWGRDLVQRYPDLLEFVGLCDINPKRAIVARDYIGAPGCATFTNVDEMIDQAKPDLLMVTTVDGFHHEYIIKGLDRGLDVMTEKPLTTDETKCQAILDAEKRNNKKIVVTFNYRYAPAHQQMKEILLSGEIGKIISVDFSWYLDVIHGADYFRRWHRLRKNSGSLFVHKATHHFDLMNWWLGADPVEVSAAASLRTYGKNGPFRFKHCRGCPHQKQCAFYRDITKDPELASLYVACESA